MALNDVKVVVPQQKRAAAATCAAATAGVRRNYKAILSNELQWKSRNNNNVLRQLFLFFVPIFHNRGDELL